MPHATLHCLYNFAPGVLLGYEEGSIGLNGLPVTPDIQELARRYRYIGYAMKRLEDMGVVQVGSVSRRGVVKEMNEAICLAYPCDTIRYTEGFSVTTMEACAAGLVPVISGEDALDSIYGNISTMVSTPVSEHLDMFVNYVVYALTSSDARSTDPGRALAAAHAWPVLAERLETILRGEMEKKSPHPQSRRKALDERKLARAPVKEDGGFPIGLCLWGSGTSHEVSEAIKKSQTERGPYECEGNPVPEGARVAEWYVNHHYHGHKTMRYWTTWDVMVGGTIYDKAEWYYLQRRYGLTHIVNVESEHSDADKAEIEQLSEEARQADDATPRRLESMLAVLQFAATRKHPAPKFYVHCQMGGSRSPAYAYLLLRGLKGMTREQALAEIHRTRPEYAGPTNPGHHLTYLKSADEAVRQYNLAQSFPLGVIAQREGAV